MQWLDWLILFVYLASLTAIGVYFSRRQSSFDEFFKGGRSAGWLTVGVSLMAALNSGTDYIQTPAVVFAFGMVYVALVLTWIPLYPWVTRVTIPFYRKLKVNSVYEYLELRFGLGVRFVASSIFVMWRVGWMGVALYVPCLAVKGATSNEIDITVMVIILGTVVTLYTLLGGIKAVIWTDVLQFCVMFGGLFATLAYIVSSVPGGMQEVWTTASETGRLNFSANISGFSELDFGDKIYHYFTTEITFVGVVSCILLGRLAAYTSDQVAVQRFQTMASDREARRAFFVSALADVVWMVVLGFVGLALYAYYLHQPLPDGLQNDRILPYFMAQNFPIGLTGLVVASIIAASLSSVDAALNSTTSIIVVDFYNRIWLRRSMIGENMAVQGERQQVIASRCINAGLGILMTVFAANVESMGEIYTIANKVLGAFFGTLFGLFVLGMFTRRANGRGVIIGAMAGLSMSCFLAFFSEWTILHGWFTEHLGLSFVDFFSHISWQWPPIVGVFTTVSVGYLVSCLLPSSHATLPPLTYWEVMQLPDTHL